MILARLAVLKKKHEMKPQAMREFLGFLCSHHFLAKNDHDLTATSLE